MVTAFSEEKKIYKKNFIKIISEGKKNVIYKKHFYIQYNGGQEKNHIEIKIEKSKMLVTISPQTHGEQSLFFLPLIKEFFKFRRSTGKEGFPGGSVVKDPSVNAGDAEDTGLVPGWEDLLEEGVAVHSSIFAWEIP